MIDLYYWPTPNGWKVTIMLEECGLDYNLIPVNIGAGEQFSPDFLKISPNNRMPAIVDHNPVEGTAPISLFESGAILEYLAEKTGQFLPTDTAGKYQVLQWVHWQMANLGPMMGNANHFRNYATNFTDDQTKLEYGINRFVNEVDRLAGILDAQLSANAYVAGDNYTIADIITWPWAFLLRNMLGEGMLDDFPHLKRWAYEIRARPAVERGFRAGQEMGKAPRSDAEENARRALLFNQDNASVKAARDNAAREQVNRASRKEKP